MKFLCKSLAETKKAAAKFLKTLPPPAATPTQSAPRPGLATVVALRGDLGAGKTTFVQCLGSLLGFGNRLTSPTFVIIKKYKLDTAPWTHMVHIDAYRLRSGEELKKLGWENIINSPRNLVLIEWPENVAEVLPPSSIFIDLEFVNKTTRMINFR